MAQIVKFPDGCQNINLGGLIMRIFPDVPPLILPGEGLTDWIAKRSSLRDTIEWIEYGCRPDVAYDVRCDIVSESHYPHENAVRRIVNITISTERGTHSFPMYIFLPKVEQPVPATLLICSQSKVLAPIKMPEGFDLSALPDMFRKMGIIMDGPLDTGGERRALDMAADMDDGHWPVPAILERGHAVAGFYATDAQADSGDFGCGLAAVFGTGKERKTHEWGILASRCGKAALWAAVKDERFAWVMPNNSGCCGAALLRGKHGENMTSINAMMPYWFAPAFRSYLGREQELPFDQHTLLALIAPRILYVTSGSEDYWADPEGEHRSAVLANEVFRLYGNPAMPEAFPDVNSPVQAGAEGYHLRKGPHLLTEYDWMMLLHHVENQ